MPFSTVVTPEAKPVANYKMGTRMEGEAIVLAYARISSLHAKSHAA